MATYINRQGETIVMKLCNMTVEQKREYNTYRNSIYYRKEENKEKRNKYNKETTERYRKYRREHKRKQTGFYKSNGLFETTDRLQINVARSSRRQFNLIQSYIRQEINEPDVLKDLALLEDFLAKQATKPEPFIVQLGDIVCEISRYILNRLKDGTHSLRVIVYSKTKNEIVLGSNSLLVKQLVSL